MLTPQPYQDAPAGVGGPAGAQPAGLFSSANDDRYRSLVECLSNAVIVFAALDDGADFVLVEFNRAAETMTGLGRDEVLGRKILDVFPGVADCGLLEAYRRVMQSGVPEHLRSVHYCDHRYHAWRNAYVYRLPAGEIVGVYEDITDRKRVEEGLRESEARFRAVFENAKVGIAMVDLDGGLIQVNGAFAEMLGYRPGELAGVPLAKFTHAADEEVNARNARLLVSGEIQSYTMTKRFIRRDGSAVWTRLTASMVRSATGQPLFRVGMVEDITEQKRIEEQLVRAERLETAGRVAGQVAHDFNNLLSPIAAYTELLRMDLPDGHPSAKYCQAIHEAAMQMAEINRDLLALGRRAQTRQSPVDVNRLVSQAVSALHELPSGIRITLSQEQDLRPVSGSASQLLRVVTNLLSNARDAVGEVGQIEIVTSNVRATPPGGGATAQPVECVAIRVRDDGCGIPEELIDHVFDAFFTTKPADRRRGSGLGLSVVQAIVEDHRGWVGVESVVGRGSVFTVHLPAIAAVVEEVRPAGIPGGEEHVLVVDDEPLQRDVVSSLLRRLGYTVDTVTSGEEALEYLATGRAPDLLVLDMVMPDGMDGAETYRRALESRPGIKAIIASGMADSDRVRAALDLGAGAFVKKPLTLGVLAHAVRTTLDG